MKNIGKVTIEHSDSKIRIFPISRSEIEKSSEDSDDIIQDFELPNDAGKVIEPFIGVYTVPETWGRKTHPGGVYPFVIRPGEEISVDVPVVINDLSIDAIRVYSSFHCTKEGKVTIVTTDSEEKEAEYGVQSQNVFNLFKTSNLAQ